MVIDNELMEKYIAENMSDRDFSNAIINAYIKDLIEKYIAGDMSDWDFSNAIINAYSHRFTGEGITEEESSAIRRLSEVAGRYSPFEEDLKIPNAFFSPQDLYAAALIAGEELGLK